MGHFHPRLEKTLSHKSKEQFTASSFILHDCMVTIWGFRFYHPGHCCCPGVKNPSLGFVFVFFNLVKIILNCLLAGLAHWVFEKCGDFTYTYTFLATLNRAWVTLGMLVTGQSSSGKSEMWCCVTLLLTSTGFVWPLFTLPLTRFVLCLLCWDSFWHKAERKWVLHACLYVPQHLRITSALTWPVLCICIKL